MEQKKSSRANLERQRSIFFEFGLIISLVILLMAFECSQPTGNLMVLNNGSSFTLDEEFPPITRRKKKPEVKILKPKDVLVVIEDNIEVPDEDILDINSEGGENIAIEPIDLPDEKPVEEELPFVSVQNQAEFPGGYIALQKFLRSNIVYPAEARELNISGTVYLRFVVLKNGQIGAIELLRSVDPLLDNEAIRVVSLMPKWNPGKNAGKPVSCWFSLPIKFELQ